MNRQDQKVRDDAICVLFLIGKTLKAIGLTYNLTGEGVRRVLVKRGLSREGSGSALKDKKENLIQHINGWQC